MKSCTYIDNNEMKCVGDSGRYSSHSFHSLTVSIKCCCRHNHHFRRRNAHEIHYLIFGRKWKWNFIELLRCYSDWWLSDLHYHSFYRIFVTNYRSKSVHTVQERKKTRNILIDTQRPNQNQIGLCIFTQIKRLITVRRLMTFFLNA